MKPTEEQNVDLTRNPAAEREVIGSVIRAPALIDLALGLRADDFAIAPHQVIWRAIAKLLDRGDAIATHTVAAACGNAIDDAQRRGLESMVQMSGGTVGILEDAVAATMDASRRRQIATTWATARRRAMTSDDSIEATVAKTGIEVEDAFDRDGVPFMDGRDVVRRLRAKLENPPRPVPTGIEKLDHVLEGGLRPGRMMGIAAQTKMGKTTLAATISENVLQRREPHLVITLEKTGTDIEQSCAARSLGIDTIKLESNFEKYREAFDAYADRDVQALRTYKHKPGAMIEEILRTINRAHRAGARGFILDYWQLIARPPRESVTDHLSRCALALSATADRLGMWAVVNAQSHADGMPRDCQALWLASSVFYVLKRSAPDKPEAWLECLGSNYTAGYDAGGPGTPSMMLETRVGPYFKSA